MEKSVGNIDILQDVLTEVRRTRGEMSGVRSQMHQFGIAMETNTRRISAMPAELKLAFAEALHDHRIQCPAAGDHHVMKDRLGRLEGRVDGIVHESDITGAIAIESVKRGDPTNRQRREAARSGVSISPDGIRLRWSSPMMRWIIGGIIVVLTLLGVIGGDYLIGRDGQKNASQTQGADTDAPAAFSKK
jgi:DNA-binding FrmR family transcriptional regulator